MSWVSPQDILDRWVGGGAPTDEDLIQALINDAEAVVLAEYPKIQDRVTAGTLSITTIHMVVSRMVMRVLRNPEGLSYWQQNTGPFGQGKSYGSGSATDIWLSPEEKAFLAPKKKGKAFEIDLGVNAVPGVPVYLMTGDGYEETPYLVYALGSEVE